MPQRHSLLVILTLGVLAVSVIAAVKELDFIDKDETKLVLVLASQRAGVSLSGCLAGKLAEGKNLGYQYSGAPVGPDTIAKALHRFRSSPARPPLMLTSGDKMAETCYEAADGKLKTCPTDRDTCPCVDGKLKCMSLGYCWHALPNVRMKVINFIRNPIDTIISSYAYHVSNPAPEEWLTTTPVKGYASWMVDQGLDNTVLKQLKVFDQPDKMSYHEFLRSIPPGKGVQLEFCRLSYYLWGMTRQHRRFKNAHMSSEQYTELRYEDFTTSFANASKAFLTFVNASAPEDEEKLLKAMGSCEDKQGVGLRRRKLLGVEEPVVYIGVDAAPLAAEGRHLVEQPAQSTEDEDTLTNRFADLITKVVEESSAEVIVRTQAAEDSTQEAEGNKVHIPDVKHIPAAEEGVAPPKEALVVEEKPFEEVKTPERPVKQAKVDPNVDFKLGKKEITALGKALMKSSFIEDELCQMVTILGYDDPRCSDSTSLTANPF